MAAFTVIPSSDLGTPDPCRAVILDVRTQAEYTEKHLSARHAFIPLDSLDPDDFINRHGLDRGVHIFTVCRTGKRAQKAAQQFSDAGFAHVTAVEGGIPALEAAGYAVEGTARQGPAGPMSIERQVRIGAGGLVLLGLLLAYLIHPVFLLLSAFVGAGLVFAGITDFCGMALLLMRAPWNANCAGSACSMSSRPSKGGGCQ